MKPRIGITIGDVAGVGPEVAVKAAMDPSVLAACIPILIGEYSVIAHYVRHLASGTRIVRIQSPVQASAEAGSLQLLDLRNIDFSKVSMSRVDRSCGQAALEYIRTGVELCLQKQIEAIVTGPIHKEAVQLAGIGAPGHTEYLASLCGVPEVRMLLVVGHLRAMHITSHMSLRQALEAVHRNRILDTIRFAVLALEQLGVKRGRIAVAGLNPHAGEAGLFGDEEIREIEPAVREARSLGIDVTGPIPPDTVFHRMNQQEYDLVVALYHDQGHIPLKLAGFDTGVNITIGLPIIRTSVDHGTAFDIAGTMSANPRSMISAIELACTMATNRR